MRSHTHTIFLHPTDINIGSQGSFFPYLPLTVGGAGEEQQVMQPGREPATLTRSRILPAAPRSRYCAQASRDGDGIMLRGEILFQY